MNKKTTAMSKKTATAISRLITKGNEPEVQAAEIASQTPHKGDEPKVKPTMAAQMRKHRDKYAPCVSYTNRLSLNNGDEVATLLQGSTPEAVMRAAEILCGFEEGELVAKYAHLNKGQQRMNAGNRIRGLVKKGKILPADLETALH